MSTLHTYNVTGKGSFPLDMLRYDTCWPSRQDDVSDLVAAKAERTVRIASWKPPTIARWNSFGWRVSDERTQR